MRHARTSRAVLGGMLALTAAASTGCTHNYYYSGSGPGPCAPTTVIPGTVGTLPSTRDANTYSYGEVCDVPTQVYGGASSAVGTPISTAPILSANRPPRVVVSEPTRGGSRFGAWRPMDPESNLATTRVQGGLDDPTRLR